jgi:phosphoglucomutase/phosphomannomutase
VGFKYIAEVLWQLEQTGAYEDVSGAPEDFVLGTEESHGYLVTPKIRDKDAAASALLLAELSLDLKRQGKTVLDYLDEIYRCFGYFQTRLDTIVMTGIQGKQKMARMLDALRKEPPVAIGGLPVTRFEDLLDEEGRLGPLQGATDRGARNFLLFRLDERGRIALRPSGTEPKAKAYLEVWSAPRGGGMSDVAWRQSCEEVERLMERLSKGFQQLVVPLGG